MRGQFQLRKWRANDTRILQHFAKECRTDGLLTLDEERAFKTLRLLWNAAEDCLQYQFDMKEIERLSASY